MDLTKTILGSLSAFCLVAMTPACKKVDDGTSDAAQSGTTENATVTLAEALGDADGFGTLRKAIDEAQLGPVLDGQASYTLLAPDDAAFKALGDKGTALMDKAQRPLLVGVLRDHMLPGHVTPESIGQAIDAKGGPVTMTTLGGGDVTFAKAGDGYTASLANGGTVKLKGTATATTNGVVVPVDAVLLPST